MKMNGKEIEKMKFLFGAMGVAIPSVIVLFTLDKFATLGWLDLVGIIMWMGGMFIMCNTFDKAVGEEKESG